MKLMKMMDLMKLSKTELKGKVVCFPTDTVYGVGAMITDAEGINKIYQLKHRNPNKPLAILAPSIESILPYIEYPSLEVFDLMKKYWPGALTIIFKKNLDEVLPFNRGYETIGFRIPKSKIALTILQHFGPMATTSMNLSGSLPLNDYDMIQKNFGTELDYIVEDDEIQSDISSTIVDATVHPFRILRQGDIKIQ